jgi:hypothetical protein
MFATITNQASPTRPTAQLGHLDADTEFAGVGSSGATSDRYLELLDKWTDMLGEEHAAAE